MKLGARAVRGGADGVLSDMFAVATGNPDGKGTDIAL